MFSYLISPLLAQQTVLLKDGRNLKGKIVSQDARTLILESEEARISISKDEILKVVFRQVDESEAEEIRNSQGQRLTEEKSDSRKEKRKKELEEKRKKLKEWEEKELAILKEREEKLKEKKKSDEISRKLPSPDRNFNIHYDLYQAFTKADLKLAPANAKCSEFAKSSDWYLLFGSMPITRPDVQKLLPQDKRGVRIRGENTWLDIGVTVILGFLVTLTRKTIVVETCELPQEPKTYTKEELELELDKQRFRIESDFRKEKEDLLLQKELK